MFEHFAARRARHLGIVRRVSEHPAGPAATPQSGTGTAHWVAERLPGGWVLGAATSGVSTRPLTVRYADGRTMTYRVQLPIAVKTVREGTLLFDAATDVAAMARAAQDRPGELVARLLREKNAPVAVRDIRAELADLGVVDAEDAGWWKLAQRDLRADPHVVVVGSKYAWSATPAATVMTGATGATGASARAVVGAVGSGATGTAGRSPLGSRRVAAPEDLLEQAVSAGAGDGAHAARVRHDIERALAQGRFPPHLAPLARGVLDPASLTGSDLPGELLDAVPPELSPLVLAAGRRAGDTRVVLSAWLLAREDADREAAREVLGRRDPGELSEPWQEWVRRRARQLSPDQRSEAALDRFLEQGQRLVALVTPTVEVLAGLLELLAALDPPIQSGATPQTYEEAVDWVRAEVRSRAADAAALAVALDQLPAEVPAAVGTAALLGTDWSAAGLRRQWVSALAASAHRDLLDRPSSWEGITLPDVAQPGSEELAGQLLDSVPGPGLVAALLDAALAQPSARAVGVVLCLDPDLLATVRPESFARAMAALAAKDGPARELIAAYDSYVRTGLRLDVPSTAAPLPR